MVGRKDNLKALFANAKTRTVILFTTGILVLAVLIGLYKFFSSTDTGPLGGTSVTSAPAAIRSVPGVLEPTAQYAKLQEEQNISQAEQALQSGNSAIPTIIRTQTINESGAGLGSEAGQGGKTFSTLAQENEGGAQRSLWIQSIKDANCSRASVDNVLAQGGSLSEVKEACGCIRLKDVGISLKNMDTVCSCPELKASGVGAVELKAIGYTAKRLRECGYDACQLKNAGFSATDMKNAGFSDDELKGAGFSKEEIIAAGGLPAGIDAKAVRDAGCGVEALRDLRAKGVSAAAIKRISGCSARALLAAGYTPKELHDAGFSAAELLKAGLSPRALRDAGFTARELLDAGLTPADLLASGFNAQDLRDALSRLPQGVNSENVKQAECDPEKLRLQRLAGVSADVIKAQSGCSAAALKKAGYGDIDLANAGFSAADIASSNFPDDAYIRQQACDPKRLAALRIAGVSAKRIRDLNGCSAESLRQAGFGADALREAGFNDALLKGAGFSDAQLVPVIDAAAAIANGRLSDCSVESLRKARAAGVSALTIKRTLGCSARAMRDAGYTAAELKDAGFSAAELKDAGFSAKELKDAGFTAAELKDAGFDAAALKAAGFDAQALKDAGFNAEELKDAGFGAKALLAAGFTPKDLKDAGFDAAALSEAGVSNAVIGTLGYGEDALKTGLAGLAKPNLPGLQPSSVTGLPALQKPNITQQAANAAERSNAQQLQEILDRQTRVMDENKLQQKIQQRTSEMLGAGNQLVQNWQKVATQAYVATDEEDEKKNQGGIAGVAGQNAANSSQVASAMGANNQPTSVLLKTGDVVFAVLDTSVNSDEPGPILATVVSGQFKGARLIGSFNLPANADKMVINFNTMSVPGASRSTSISAYAIDPDTARTALSSRTDNHYLSRYGSLFASTFLEGFGNAFQSANTTVTVGGTGGGNNITVQNGIGRSTLENAVIGLATVGKAWGQFAKQQFNRPKTVMIYSGTPLGILFTQDLASL